MSTPKNNKKCDSKMCKNRDEITYFNLLIKDVFLMHNLERRRQK